MASGKDFKEVLDLLLTLNNLSNRIHINYTLRNDYHYHIQDCKLFRVFYLYKFSNYTRKRLGYWKFNNLETMITTLNEELEYISNEIDKKNVSINKSASVCEDK